MNACLHCGAKLTPAGAVGQFEDIDSCCQLCNIFYAGDEPIFLIKGSSVIPLREEEQEERKN